jgi:hypothetical protein
MIEPRSSAAIRAVWPLLLLVSVLNAPCAQQVSASAGPFSAISFDNPKHVLAPLSLDESIDMLRAAVNLVETGQLNAATTPTLDLMLRSVAIYMEQVDRSKPILGYYTWKPISDKKALVDDGATQTFTLRKPIENVSAISLKVNNTDVQMHYMRVYDGAGHAWEFTRERIIASNQPRRELYFMPLPSTVSRVEITTSWTKRQPVSVPRIYVDAGITPIPESAKQSNYYIRGAREALIQGNQVLLLQSLNSAMQKVEEFQATRPI